MSIKGGFLAGLGVAFVSCSAPRPAQSAGLGIGGDGFDERTYTLSVHGVAHSRMNLSGSVSSIPVSGPRAGLQAWAVEAADLGQRINWLFGYGERSLQESVNFVEIYGGGMLNLTTSTNWIPYLIGTLRYSQELKFPTTPPTESSDFFGWSGGVGLRHYSTDRFFLDLRVTYEATFTDIDAGMTRNLNVQGLLATVGAGFTF